MAATGVSLTVMKQCVEIFRHPLKSKRYYGRVFKFAEYVHHYKSLPRTIFGLILKKMAVTGFSLIWSSRSFIHSEAFSHLWKVLFMTDIFDKYIYILFYLQIFDLIACLIFKNKKATMSVFLWSARTFTQFEAPEEKVL